MIEKYDEHLRRGSARNVESVHSQSFTYTFPLIRAISHFSFIDGSLLRLLLNRIDLHFPFQCLTVFSHWQLMKYGRLRLLTYSSTKLTMVCNTKFLFDDASRILGTIFYYSSRNARLFVKFKWVWFRSVFYCHNIVLIYLFFYEKHNYRFRKREIEAKLASGFGNREISALFPHENALYFEANRKVGLMNSRTSILLKLDLSSLFRTSRRDFHFIRAKFAWGMHDQNNKNLKKYKQYFSQKSRVATVCATGTNLCIEFVMTQREEAFSWTLLNRSRDSCDWRDCIGDKNSMFVPLFYHLMIVLQRQDPLQPVQLRNAVPVSEENWRKRDSDCG